MDDWENDGVFQHGSRADTAAVIGNWQELFHDLRNEPGNHLVVTSNGIARFALNAANAQRSDAKLATAAWGVIVVEAGEARVEAWNLRAPT